MDRDYTRDKLKDHCFICGRMGHHGYAYNNVSVKIRDKHISRCKEDLDAKRAPKIGTQHAAVEEEEISVVSIFLEDHVFPLGRKNLLRF